MVLKKKLLKDVAYEKIKEKILRGDDNYTSENSLVEELQMSRTPIREALQRLQHEGFIKILPNQGITIPDLSVKETNDIFDYRLAIETASLKQAVHLLKQEDFDALSRNIENQISAVNQNDLFLFIEYDMEFHLYLLKVVGNELFIQGIEHVIDRLHRLSRRIKNNPQKLSALIQEHIRIMDFLKDKEIDLAVKELEDHLKGGKINMYGGI
jgi:DNA-binding GntR family transcriptional regulator